MAEVFISYKSQRRPAARHLAKVLELHGYSVWFDWGLVSGSDFGPQIERELRQAKAAVVLWCTMSRDSHWVREEADLAHQRGIIVPTWIERVDPPLGLRRLDTIDLTGWDGAPRSPVLDRLLLEIAKKVGRDPAPDFQRLVAYEQSWRDFGRPSLASWTQDVPPPEILRAEAAGGLQPRPAREPPASVPPATVPRPASARPAREPPASVPSATEPPATASPPSAPDPSPSPDLATPRQRSEPAPPPKPPRTPRREPSPDEPPPWRTPALIVAGVGALGLFAFLAWPPGRPSESAAGSAREPRCGTRKTIAGLEYVYVCGGEFTMGSNDGRSDEKPPHKVRISSFWMQRYEFRRGEAKGRSQSGDPRLPLTNIDWADARGQCEAYGARLPTEAEWEYAARGKKSRKYPWGDAEPTKRRARFGLDYIAGPEPVDARPAGKGPFGTEQQAGNVWEWVCDAYDKDAYSKAPRGDDPSAAITDPSVGCDAAVGVAFRVVRGGSFGNSAVYLRSAYRLRNGPGDEDDLFLGFRCARSPLPSMP